MTIRARILPARLCRALPVPVLTGLLLLAACATPPPESYVASGASRGSGAGAVSIGVNAAGEACMQQRQSTGDAYVYCGTWERPSGHVVPLGPGGPAQFQEVITGSTWRASLEIRYVCGNATPTTVLGGLPALTMGCTRKIGGWPQVAFVTSIDNHLWAADAVAPALPAVQQAMSVLSGRSSPGAAPVASASDALSARRLATQALSSGDIGQYEQLIAAGSRANLTGDYAAAELAYRAAATLQAKALGRDNPNVATPLMNEAVQLSDQGRYGEAETLFARADAMVRSPAMSDKTAAPRLLHYRALDQLNQHQPAKALALLKEAERGYSDLLPAAALTTDQRNSATGAFVPLRGAAALLQQAASADLFSDPTVGNALVGLVEARRDEAVALKQLGRPDESEQASRAAADLAQAQRLAEPRLSARLYRTSALIAEQQGRPDAALSDLGQSAANFARAFPNSRPVAITALLRAARLLRTGQDDRALAACREAVRVLRSLKSGIDGPLMEPCLDAYAKQAASSGGDRQAILAEMFEAAQLAQGSVTSQQIAQASALLSENARDPRVGEAIRRREASNRALADLYSERDELATDGRAAGTDSADLDKRIADAQAAVADADAALQVASPNYGQLVQQVVSAQDVMAVLRPDEAFASMVLGESAGWTFMLRTGRIDVARIDGGVAPAAALVKRIRSSMDNEESGPPPPFDTDAARALYAALFGGLDEQMKGLASITVAPTGPLLSIPFGLLLTGPAAPDDLAHAPWLIRRMTVAHVPAAANFVTLRKVAAGSRAQQAWFGFGDFQPVTLRQAQATFPAASCGDSARLLAGLPPLPGARAELDAARKIFGASAQDEMLGDAFTAQRVQSAPLKDFRVLHFATHALLPTDLKCQSEPSIVTSNARGAQDAAGALLTASQVAHMELDADAVILSACNTGGPSGAAAGESLSGLARSFFFAGARALLITHWSVSDRFTAYLVALTLDAAKRQPDQGLASSLRSAQLRVLDEATGELQAQAHPFFWAPLALIGDGGGAAAHPQTAMR